MKGCFDGVKEVLWDDERAALTEGLQAFEVVGVGIWTAKKAVLAGW